ncbi:MAG: hypothetical protein Q8R00_03920 [Candidatus Nanoarchaeia archaeon]|nr:hypothetical protein [Candidatus Nanoarchaeia archaeon]
MDGKYTMMKNKIRFAIMSISILLIILPLVSAFGVTSPYWEGHVLSMKPGETKVISLILQNMVGEEDIRLGAKIGDGSDIASLVGNEIYKVPFGKKDVDVKIKITIPNNAPFGKTYEVAVLFSQLGEEEAGNMVQFTTAVGTRIPIVVSPAGETNPVTAEVVSSKAFTEFGTKTFLVFLIVAILVLILLFVRKKK